jgi:VanZ family protein
LENKSLGVGRKIAFFIPAMLWALLIYALSTNTPPHLPVFSLLSLDKVGHLVFYAVFTAALLLPTSILKTEKRALTGLNYLTCFGIAAVYGVALEFVQANLPHRSFDYADMIANCIGAALACLAFSKILRTSYYANFQKKVNEIVS